LEKTGYLHRFWLATRQEGEKSEIRVSRFLGSSAKKVPDAGGKLGAKKGLGVLALIDFAKSIEGGSNRGGEGGIPRRVSWTLLAAGNKGVRIRKRPDGKEKRCSTKRQNEEIIVNS